MNIRALMLVLAALLYATALQAQSPSDDTASDGQESADTDSTKSESATDSDAPRKPYLDLRRVPMITGDPEAGRAKSEVCANCHGQNGIAIVPDFPNLAGLSADFMYWQLVKYKRGVNPSPMTPLVADLSEEDMRDLAMHYASLPVGMASPTETDGSDEVATDPALLKRGEHLYLAGDPARGIPSCQGCHGTDARGPAAAQHQPSGKRGLYTGFPALRGQHSGYLKTKLADYRDGNMADSTSGFVMTGVAETLDEDAIAALSGWLSSLEHDPSSVPTPAKGH